MTRWGALATVATILWTASAAAQPPGQSRSEMRSLSKIPSEPRSSIRQRAFAYPIADYESEGGLLQPRQGIIAGKQIAPGTMLGVGVFRIAPKPRGYVGDMPPNMAPPKKTRQAAVGLSWRF